MVTSSTHQVTRVPFDRDQQDTAYKCKRTSHHWFVRREALTRVKHEWVELSEIQRVLRAVSYLIIFSKATYSSNVALLPQPKVITSLSHLDRNIYGVGAGPELRITLCRVPMSTHHRSGRAKHRAADCLLLLSSYFHPVCDLCALTLKQQAAVMLSGLHYRLHLTLQSISTLHTWAGVVLVFMSGKYYSTIQCFYTHIFPYNTTDTHNHTSSWSDQVCFTQIKQKLCCCKLLQGWIEDEIMYDDIQALTFIIVEK